MDMNSVMYQLMDTRTNGILNSIVEADAEYQETSRRSDEYSDKLMEMDLTDEAKKLIDRYVSEENTLGARYGALAYLLGFSDCVELMTKPFHFETMQKAAN